MPKVSVIVPNYNHSKYLDQRLTSVLQQTYQDLEIIILDDKSTDDSREQIEHYRKNKHVSNIVYNSTNSGSTFKQWQKGVDLAKGDLIWIAESDDWCANSFLENLVPLFEKDEEVVLAYTDSLLYLEHAHELVPNHWGKWLDQEKWMKNYVAEGSAEIATVLVYLNSILNASAVVFKRQTFLDINFKELLNYKYAGDWFAWSFLLSKGKASYIAEPLNYFRIHSSSTRNNKPFQEEIRRFREIFHIISSNRARALKAGYQLHSDNYEWLFKEWVTSKSKGHSQKLMLIKVLPGFLLLPYFKYLGLYYTKMVVSKTT